MAEQIYTPQKIEELQMQLLALVSYVKRHDKQTLPRCVSFCETIIRNIDICRANGYVDIEELSALIRQDWNSAMEIHTGLPEYYIPNDVFAVQQSMNAAISAQIRAIERTMQG